MGDDDPPRVASNCKDKQDIGSPASFNGKNKLSTHIDAKLNKLHLQTFRNYQIADLDLESDAVVLTGSNGAGKTNVLEAVSMLAQDEDCGAPVANWVIWETSIRQC